MNGTIAIVGASGNIGKRLAEGLLQRQKKVRAIGRNAEHLKALKDKGAEIVIGDILDTKFLQQAFKGASAAYTMIPPNYGEKDFSGYQARASEAQCAAIAAEKVAYVVNLSSVGAHLPSKTGPILGLHLHEKKLNAIPNLNVVHLRPGYFMENHFSALDLIRKMNITGSALRADLSIPMIATRDIGDVAAKLLANLNFSGKSTMELLGQRNLTPAESFEKLTAAIGKKGLPYIQFPYADAEKAMKGMGLSESMARLMVEMCVGFNDNYIQPEEKRSLHNTTPTSIEEFAKTFAQIYNK